MTNHHLAEEAIKAVAPRLTKEVLNQICGDPKTITETSDFGFSQTRECQWGGDAGKYDVQVWMIVLARVKRDAPDLLAAPESTELPPGQ